jgi:hypothetical protein
MTLDLITRPLTGEQKGRICGVLSIGCDRQTAANVVGCSLADIRRAMQADAEFSADLRRSVGHAELSHMNMVHKAAQDVKNWRVSVWWLQRHAPERYARSAGQITSRQLKAFIAIVAEIVNDDSASHSPAQILARLRLLFDSVDRLLRDDELPDADPFGIATIDEAEMEIESNEFTRDADDFDDVNLL